MFDLSLNHPFHDRLAGRQPEKLGKPALCQPNRACQTLQARRIGQIGHQQINSRTDLTPLSPMKKLGCFRCPVQIAERRRQNLQQW